MIFKNNFSWYFHNFMYDLLLLYFFQFFLNTDFFFKQWSMKLIIMMSCSITLSITAWYNFVFTILVFFFRFFLLYQGCVGVSCFTSPPISSSLFDSSIFISLSLFPILFQFLQFAAITFFLV